MPTNNDLSEGEQKLYVTGVYAQQLLDSEYYQQVVAELNYQISQEILQTSPEAQHKREYLYTLNRAVLAIHSMITTSASIPPALDHKLQQLDEDQLELFPTED